MILLMLLLANVLVDSSTGEAREALNRMTAIGSWDSGRSIPQILLRKSQRNNGSESCPGNMDNPVMTHIYFIGSAHYLDPSILGQLLRYSSC